MTSVGLAQACGGRSVELPVNDTPNDTGGTGAGRTSKGGMPATGQAGSSGRVGAALGGRTSGTGGAPSSAGQPGSGGKRSSAGTSNGGDGQDNMGGAGSPQYPIAIQSNAECSCRAPDSESYECTMPLAAKPIVAHATGICSQDAVTTRVPCDNGGYWYSWLEGDENEYDLEVDQSGNPVYYAAGAYVDECGVDPTYRYGSITAGSQVGECYTDDGCAPCDDGSPLPRCLDCTPIPESNTVSVPLDEYCAANICPPNVAGVRQYLAGSCAIEPHSQIIRGCGDVSVIRQTGDSLLEFFYDEATDTLTGVLEGRDAPYGQCHSKVYLAGALPSDCQTVTTCEFCSPSADGLAGAAGEGGRGGADNLCAP